MFHHHRHSPATPNVLVREYTSTHDFQKDAQRLARQGYRITGTSQRHALGLPLPFRAAIHTRYTVTYQFDPATGQHATQA